MSAGPRARLRPWCPSSWSLRWLSRLLARKEINREIIVSGAQSRVLIWKRSNGPPSFLEQCSL